MAIIEEWKKFHTEEVSRNIRFARALLYGPRMRFPLNVIEAIMVLTAPPKHSREEWEMANVTIGQIVSIGQIMKGVLYEPGQLQG